MHREQTPPVTSGFTVLTKQQKPKNVEKKRMSAGMKLWGERNLAISLSRDPHSICMSMSAQCVTSSPTYIRKICQHKHHSEAYYNTFFVSEAYRE